MINFRVSTTLDKSGANKPILSSNMIPVYYDISSKVWKKADSTNLDRTYKWYDYNNQMWANSVTVSSANRNVYLNASAGTTIPMTDILTMQVWIPRYKYKIFNYNANGLTYLPEQQIDVVFEEDKNKSGDILCVDDIKGTGATSSETCKLKASNEVCSDNTCNGKYYTHPAFTFGSDELSGIWVGKFETTGTIDSITIKPSLISLRSQNVSSLFNSIKGMNSNANKYGFSSSDDVHMMKNMEWGSIAYLAMSKYGKQGNISK